jgi:MazG family protein
MTEPREPDPRVAAFRRLLEVVDRLRAPDGCPWDRSQTLPSMASHVLEEAHELVDALRLADEDPRAEREARKEAGDLLMNVLLIARIGQDEGRFTLEDLAEATAEKLVRRHPHVFGSKEAEDADAAFLSWEEVKRQERAAEEQPEHRSVLSGVPQSLPALLRAQRSGDKVASVGFEWPGLDGPFAKAREELDELEEEARAEHREAAQLEHELGDVLFSVINLARHLGVDAEMALRRCVDRFSRRFRYVEEQLGERLGEASLEEMDRHWDAAKALEGDD